MKVSIVIFNFLNVCLNFSPIADEAGHWIYCSRHSGRYYWYHCVHGQEEIVHAAVSIGIRGDCVFGRKGCGQIDVDVRLCYEDGADKYFLHMNES